MTGQLEPVRVPAQGERVGVRADDVAAAWCHGVVLAWAGEDGGPQATLAVGRPQAQALDGVGVWVRAMGPDRTQQWFHGGGRAAGAEVLVEDPVVVAIETRRASIRVPLPGQASIAAEDGSGSIVGGLVDISGAGCRLRLRGDLLPQPGQLVDLTAALSTGLLLRSTCSVTHVHDSSPPEVGLRFEDLPAGARQRLEGTILAAAARR